MSESKTRRNFNTTLNPDLYKRIKFLALKLDCHANDLIESGMSWMLKLYGEEQWTPDDLEKMKKAIAESEEKIHKGEGE